MDGYTWAMGGASVCVVAEPVFSLGLEPETVMHWRFFARSAAIGGCLMAALATGAPTGRAQAQAMSSAFNPYDPQWAFARPDMPFGFNTGGFNTGAAGGTQPLYTAPFASGMVGLSVQSTAPDTGARMMGSTGNFFDPLPFGPTLPRQDWFSSLGDPAWRTSFVGSYKSNPNSGLLDGLYTTASFGVTSFQTGSPGLPGLSNFTAGNNATGMTASAGVGFQITPQINIEGSVSFSQMPASNFR
jgi:hypothetical protein